MQEVKRQLAGLELTLEDVRGGSERLGDMTGE